MRLLSGGAYYRKFTVLTCLLMLIDSNIVTWRQNGKKRDITVVCIAWHFTALKILIKEKSR